MTDNMYDNSNFIASDEINGVSYPRVKIGTGEDGSYVDVSADNPLPVSSIGGVLEGLLLLTILQ